MSNYTLDDLKTNESFVYRIPTAVESDSSLMVLRNNHEPVFVVKPDGTVLVKGKSIEQMNTVEARAAILELFAWLRSQRNDDWYGRQTDYLLRRIEKCERRCP